MIKQLSSKIVYQNKWIMVREDDVKFSDGTKGIYGYVQKGDWVTVIPWDGKYFYLVCPYRYPHGKFSWEFPEGRHEEDNSLDLLKVAKMELIEETGIDAKNWKKIGALHPAPALSSDTFHIFIATDLTFHDKKLESSETGMKMKKVRRDELEEMLQKGEITDSPTVAAYCLFKLKYP